MAFLYIGYTLVINITQLTFFFSTTRWKRVPPTTAIHDTLDTLCLGLIKIQVHKILNICHQSAHICEFEQIGQKTDNKIEAYFFLRNCF